MTRAAQEVEEARARLASARLEERRVIRREIHDGLGPSLAGLRLGVQGARNLLDSDPSAAAELLSALQDELDQRVADVRSLSHSLLPPVLDELGLAAALHEMRARHAEDGLAVELSLGRLEGLGLQLAAAAYGIISEAVTNVARHSATTRCVVQAGTSGGTLAITVEDDGLGIAPDARPGVGAGRCASAPRSRVAGSGWSGRTAAAPACAPRSRGRWACVADTVRVAVVDDHPVFRLGMAALLSSLPDIEVVGQAASQEEALALPGRRST